jgi:hypothetical protein
MIAMLGVNANAKKAETVEASVDGLERRSCFFFFPSRLFCRDSVFCMPAYMVEF